MDNNINSHATYILILSMSTQHYDHVIRFSTRYLRFYATFITIQWWWWWFNENEKKKKNSQKKMGNKIILMEANLNLCSIRNRWSSVVHSWNSTYWPSTFTINTLSISIWFVNYIFPKQNKKQATKSKFQCNNLRW